MKLSPPITSTKQRKRNRATRSEHREKDGVQRAHSREMEVEVSDKKVTMVSTEVDTETSKT